VRLLSRVQRLEKLAEAIKPPEVDYEFTDQDAAQCYRGILSRLRISDPWPEIHGKSWLRALRALERGLGILKDERNDHKRDPRRFWHQC